MLHATIIVRPQRAELLVQRLLAAGWAEAVHATECRGFGRQRGGGEGYRIEFLAKVVVECAVDDDRREELIDLVCTTCRTGRIGDGKIFLRRIEHGS
ncbi:MAG: nitrogen regulatory protein [Planctomycetota bacterium]|jgi:nitrogen regulatory protein P-II 1